MGSLSCAVPVLRKERKRILSIPYYPYLTALGCLFVCRLFLIVLRQSRAHQAGFQLPVWKRMTWNSLISYLPGQACKNTLLWGADNQTQGLGHSRQGFSHPSCVPSLKSTVLNFHVHLSPQEDLLALRLPILTNL